MRAGTWHLARFPYLHPPPGTWAVHLEEAAGHINPRALVAAQQVLLARAGGEVVRDTVTGLHRWQAAFNMLFFTSLERAKSSPYNSRVAEY